MDEYTSDPKTAMDRGRVPEVGPRGGIRYKATGRANKPIAQPMMPMPIFIGEVKDVGVFEHGGKYVAYIHKEDETHQKIVDTINKELSSGGTIFDAMNKAKDLYT